ncbi:hypothetical protein ACNTMW_06630 [Planosporangium sp. 12N6]|uniref:hypothetical protein n=1 Tax=Planosporangium spinosum TaxID=3402278 RepID=UPI003CEE5AA8
MSPEQTMREAADLAMRLLPLAVQAAGPMRDHEDQGRYLERVRALAVDLWIESGPRSELARRLAELTNAQVFVGVLADVTIEASSTRAMLTLTVVRDGEATEEMIRTDRTDGPAGRALWETARTLTGHRVAIYKHMETRADPNKKYRCAKHIVDLGPADDTGDAGPTPTGAAPTRAGSTGATHPVPRIVAPRVPGSDPADARAEVMRALERAGHGDPAYRQAACAGIMDRATAANGTVTNLDVLLRLARTTPPADSPAGRMISSRYGQPPQRLSA